MSHLYQKNTLATILRWVGSVLLILTILFGIFFYPIIPAGLICGFLLLGVAEALKLLQGIYNRLDPEFDVNLVASDPQRGAVSKIYNNLGKTVLSIKETKMRFHYLVETTEGKEVVNIGFFEPRFMTVEAAVEQGIIEGSEQVTHI
ncbi:hypothetical protein ACFOZY_10880 [Chungangia koreensis]|uniref:DUF304 domain-containing protein n=1 Tax=Chungangia koreensis TaxID=752657 RepID=A0ABV8X573_9LACT